MWWLEYIFVPLLASFAAGLLLGLAFLWRAQQKINRLTGGTNSPTSDGDGDERAGEVQLSDEELETVQAEAARASSLDVQLRSIHRALEDRDAQINKLTEELSQVRGSANQPEADPKAAPRQAS